MKTIASHSATTDSPHPSIEPDSTHAGRATKTSRISATRSASFLFRANGGVVGIQK